MKLLQYLFLLPYFIRYKCMSLRKFTFTLFWQIFRESNAYTKYITKELIWRKNILVRVNFSFFHSVRKWYFRRDLNFFPSNQTKNVVSFTEKSCILISRNIFVEHSVVKWKIYQKIISSNQLFSNFLRKNVGFTKFLPRRPKGNIMVWVRFLYLFCETAILKRDRFHEIFEYTKLDSCGDNLIKIVNKWKFPFHEKYHLKIK